MQLYIVVKCRNICRVRKKVCIYGNVHHSTHTPAPAHITHTPAQAHITHNRTDYPAEVKIVSSEKLWKTDWSLPWCSLGGHCNILLLPRDLQKSQNFLFIFFFYKHITVTQGFTKPHNFLLISFFKYYCYPGIDKITELSVYLLFFNAEIKTS